MSLPEETGLSGSAEPLVARTGRPQVTPTRWRIATGLLGAGLLLAGTKIIAALKEVAVASKYGVGPEVDAYLVVMTVVNWLPLLLVSVATVVLVPALVASHSTDDASSCFVSELNGSMLLVAFLATTLTWWLGVPLVELIVGVLEPATRALARDMLPTLLPMALLTVMAGYLSIRQQAIGRWSYTALQGLPSLAVLVLVLAAGPGRDPMALLVGTLAGSSVQVAMLVLLTHRSPAGVGGLRLPSRSARWRAIQSAMGVLVIGEVVMSMVVPVDQFFAARQGDGSVAVLGYANRLVGLAAGLGATAISRVILPALSEIVTSGDVDRARREAWHWSAIMFATGWLFVAGCWGVAPGIVQAVFERNAFSAADTAEVAEVLRYGLAQVPFYLAGIVLVQFLAAAREVRTIVLAALVGVAVKLAVVVLLSPVFGLIGVVLSTVALYASSAAVTLIGTTVRARPAR